MRTLEGGDKGRSPLDNRAELSNEEHDRMSTPGISMEVEVQQPKASRKYLRKPLHHYDNVALPFPCGNDPVYQEDAE